MGTQHQQQNAVQELPSPRLSQGNDLSGLNQKSPTASPPSTVYRALAEHQATEKWELQPSLCELQRWAELMNRELDLRVPEIALTVDTLRYRAPRPFSLRPQRLRLARRNRD